jgi:protein SCO1/2
MSRRLVVLIAALALVLAAVSGALWLLALGPQATSQGKALVGGPFRLTSASGEVVDSETLKGKPYVIFFGFTHCPEVCPTTLYTLTGALRDMGAEGGGIPAFFVTVDPDRDTPEALKAYMESFENRVVALRPANADELSAITRTFRVFYRKQPTSDGSYTVDHTALIYLMDGDGAFFGTISYGENAETVRGKLERLVEHKTGGLLW